MAADISIHVFEGIDESDLEEFFAAVHRDCARWRDCFDRIERTPSVWIGEVSWLKADLSDDPTEYIPPGVQAVSDAIGEDLPLLDDALYEKIMAALALENTTQYHTASLDDVRQFLDLHRGERLFTVSW